MSMDKKALIAVVAELNEKGMLEVKSASKRSADELAKKILSATENGEDLEGLSKTSIATIKALLNSASPEDSGADDGEEGDMDGEDGGDETGTSEGGEEDSGADDGEDGDPELPEDLTSREAMNIAAADMNEVLNLDPAIDTTAEDRIFQRAFKRGTEIAEGTDNFSGCTWSGFAALGMGPERERRTPAKAEKTAKAGKKAVEKADKGKKDTKADKTSSKDKKAAEKAEKDAPKSGKKAAEKTAKATKEKKAKAPKAPRERKDGVTNTIGLFIREHGKSGKAFKKADLIDALVDKFPEKAAESLGKTVNMMFCAAPCFGWEIKSDGENYTAKYNG